MGYYAVYNDECLMHHGVKGMKWGVRRYQSYDVTGARKGGKTGKELGEANRQSAKALYSQAKKSARVLNRLDKHLAKDTGEQHYYDTRASAKAVKVKRIKKKIDAKAAKGKTSARLERKLAKVEAKRLKLKDIAKSYGDRIKKTEAISDRIIKDATSKGLKLNSKGVLRNATPAAQKRANIGMGIVQGLLDSAGARSTTGVYQNTYVTGTKYKADKSIKKPGYKAGRKWSSASSKNPRNKRVAITQTTIDSTLRL